MNTFKLASIATVSIVSFLALSSVALAATTVGVGVGIEAGDDNGVSGEVRVGQGSATGTTKSEDGRLNASANAEGSENGDDNGNEVSVRVRALLDVADRDGGIGKDVREIAHEFASSSERADGEREDVEGRPAWMIFLVGADYKSLGALRSEVAVTQNTINRLEDARDRATDASVKATLDVQIEALVASASSTEAYVKAHEEVFSIFGWFFKIFS